METDYAAFSIKGKAHRINEDRYRMLGSGVPLVEKAGKGQLFAVFDGMGSAPKGADAAQFMCDALIEYYRETSLETSHGRIIELLNTANLEIKSWGHVSGTDKELGACAGTVVWLNSDELTIYHAGDTLCLLIRSDCQHDDEYELLTTDQAVGDDLWAFWGMGRSLNVETWQVNIDEGDLLVLISDGVIKAIDLKTIAEKVRKWIFDSLQAAARNLCQLAQMKGSTDDITAVIVEIVEFDWL